MATAMIVRASLLAGGSLSRPVNYCSSVKFKRLYLSTRCGVKELIWNNIVLVYYYCMCPKSHIYFSFFDRSKYNVMFFFSW